MKWAVGCRANLLARSRLSGVTGTSARHVQRRKWRRSWARRSHSPTGGPVNGTGSSVPRPGTLNRTASGGPPPPRGKWRWPDVTLRWPVESRRSCFNGWYGYVRVGGKHCWLSLHEAPEPAEKDRDHSSGADGSDGKGNRSEERRVGK